uniref:Uncharacterized protein n=1 Tax=Oryza sativa subsp. japonica TaxID=39947 RepID=Q652X3_ORYSJ|nr:hypothetical protein [Oryza sativa Japonica Group]
MHCVSWSIGASIVDALVNCTGECPQFAEATTSAYRSSPRSISSGPCPLPDVKLKDLPGSQFP